MHCTLTAANAAESCMMLSLDTPACATSALLRSHEPSKFWSEITPIIALKSFAEAPTYVETHEKAGGIMWKRYSDTNH